MVKFKKLQDSITQFLFEEEGNITRNKVLVMGSMMILMSIIFCQEAFAGHESHASHASHESHASHASSSTHSSHSSSTHSNVVTPAPTPKPTPVPTPVPTPTPPPLPDVASIPVPAAASPIVSTPGNGTSGFPLPNVPITPEI